MAQVGIVFICPREGSGFSHHLVGWFSRVFWIKVKMLRCHEVTPVRTPVAGSGLTVIALGKGQNQNTGRRCIQTTLVCFAPTPGTHKVIGKPSRASCAKRGDHSQWSKHRAPALCFQQHTETLPEGKRGLAKACGSDSHTTSECTAFTFSELVVHPKEDFRMNR